MKSVSSSVQMNAPTGRVFEVMTDLAGAAERISGIKSLEVLTDGPFGVGTRFRETRVMFGKEATEVMEVTAVTPGEGYVVEAESCGSHYTSTIRVTAEGGGTRLSMEFHARPLSFVAKVMGAVMGPLMKRVCVKAIAQDLADIKAAVEGAAA